MILTVQSSRNLFVAFTFFFGNGRRRAVSGRERVEGRVETWKGSQRGRSRTLDRRGFRGASLSGRIPRRSRTRFWQNGKEFIRQLHQEKLFVLKTGSKSNFINSHYYLTFFIVIYFCIKSALTRLNIDSSRTRVVFEHLHRPPKNCNSSRKLFVNSFIIAFYVLCWYDNFKHIHRFRETHLAIMLTR